MDESGTQSARQKQQTLRRLFEDDWLLIHVDTRHAQIDVPAHLVGSPSITFKLSRLFYGATEIGEQAIRAELLFGSARHACVFPMDAVWGVTSHRGSNIIWPESTPSEILSEINKRGEAKRDPAEAAPSEDKKPRLRRIK